MPRLQYLTHGENLGVSQQLQLLPVFVIVDQPGVNETMSHELHGVQCSSIIRQDIQDPINISSIIQYSHLINLLNGAITVTNAVAITLKFIYICRFLIFWPCTFNGCCFLTRTTRVDESIFLSYFSKNQFWWCQILGPRRFFLISRQ